MGVRVEGGETTVDFNCAQFHRKGAKQLLLLLPGSPCQLHDKYKCSALCWVVRPQHRSGSTGSAPDRGCSGPLCTANSH